MKNSIIAANRQYTARVESLLAAMAQRSEAALHHQPPGGGWSAMQVLYHLVLVEEGSLAYVRKKLSFQPELEKAGFAEKLRRFYLGFSLMLPLKFKAPASAGNERIPADGTLADVTARWQACRQDWATFFDQMPEELSDKAVYRHPRAGRLGWIGMIEFIGQHFERHKKQLERTLSQSV